MFSCLYPSYFNSIKVQLKLATLDSSMMSLRYFNSIKVQLKLEQLGPECHHILFQFHKGTIKTYYSQDGTTPQSVFQFHKGTIKTCLVSRKGIHSSISIP